MLNYINVECNAWDVNFKTNEPYSIFELFSKKCGKTQELGNFVFERDIL